MLPETRIREYSEGESLIVKNRKLICKCCNLEFALPSVTTTCNQHGPMHDEQIYKIIERIKGQKVAIIADESTDGKQQYELHVLVKVLNDKRFSQRVC